MTTANAQKLAGPQRCPHCRKQLPPACPQCGALFVARNGTSGGRQNYLCSRCGKQFVADAARRRISPQTWAIVDTLLQAGVEVATIHKATSISKRQIYYRKSALEQKS